MTRLWPAHIPGADMGWRKGQNKQSLITDDPNSAQTPLDSTRFTIKYYMDSNRVCVDELWSIIVYILSKRTQRHIMLLYHYAFV